MQNLLLMIGVGVFTGTFAGVFGIGGGVILVPILVLLFKYPQHTANGISLFALLLPVGAAGAFEYYRQGKITTDQIKLALLISLGLIVGTFLGAKVAGRIQAEHLRRAFAVFLIFIAFKLWMVK